MKNKLILIPIVFLFVLSFASALSIEDSLTNYYASFQNEDLDLYYASQTFNLFTPEQIQDEKKIIEQVFKQTDLLQYSIVNLSYKIQENVAVANYIFSATISDGSTTFEYITPYVAILIKEKNWMIYKVVPQSTYDLVVLDAQKDGEFYGHNELTFKGNEIKDECVVNISLLNEVEGVNLYSVASQTIIDMIAGDKFIELRVGDHISYLGVSSGIISILSSKPESIDFISEIGDCTFEAISDETLDPMTAYNNNKITLKGTNFGSKTKVFFGKIGVKIFTLFAKKDYKITVEGESGTLGGPSAYSYIGPTSRGLGELYLGSRGSFANYIFESSYSGNMYLYVRVNDDNKHKSGSRNALFIINGKEYSYNHISTTYTPWGWEQVAQVRIEKGTNTLVIKKPTQTSAAFVMDKFLISTKEQLFD